MDRGLGKIQNNYWVVSSKSERRVQDSQGGIQNSKGQVSQLLVSPGVKQEDEESWVGMGS